MRLGAVGQAAQAELDGFKSRALRAAPPTQRHLYVTEWRAADGAGAANTGMAIIASSSSLATRFDQRIAWAQRASAPASNAPVPVVAHLAQLALLGLAALELALVITQVQAVGRPTIAWLLAAGAVPCEGTAYAGSWGLARAARTEALLPLGCLGGSLPEVLSRSPTTAEPEAALLPGVPYVPRLAAAVSFPDGLVRLQFHSRGALSTLFLEPQPMLTLLREGEKFLRVRAVGLNFRDVLNVLGEYPGDPGPPGGDTAGVLETGASTFHIDEDAVFGLAHAPLACMAHAFAPLLARKPAALAFDQACTLPTTWSTVHAAFAHAGLRAGGTIIVQAAAGGVGLKAVEYAQWLLASPRPAR